MKIVRRSKTKAIIRGTVRQSKIAVRAGANRALETMQRLVPVDEGDLKKTLKVFNAPDGSVGVSAGSQGKITDGEEFVDYEADVEFGTVHRKANGDTYSIAAQPYFRPGLDDGRKTVRRNMKITEG